MISPRLARLRKAAFVASPLCLPATATAPKGRNPYLLQPERKTVCSSWDRSFSSSSFPGRVYAGLGTAAAAAAAEGGTALGGTVAVVSPALSRPSSANESAVRREGGVRGLQRPSPSAAPLLSLSRQNGKLLPATPPATTVSTQKMTPARNLATMVAFITVPVGI